MKYVASRPPNASFLGADKLRLEPNIPAIAQRRMLTHGTSAGLAKAWSRVLAAGLAAPPVGDIEFTLGTPHEGDEEIEVAFYG